MIRNAWILLAASTAIALAAPAAAQGQSGTAPPAAQASPTAQGPAAAPAQANSQGPANAAPTATANASENSVLGTEEGAATVAADADANAKAEKKSKVTVIRAGPNAGMVINKGKKADSKDKAEAPEAGSDPQQ